MISHRPRRLRQNESIRALTKELKVEASQFILPLFIAEGKSVEKSHPLLPSCKTFSADKVLSYALKARDLGIKSLLLFGTSTKKDAKGSEALNSSSALHKSISMIREKVPEMIIMTDIALDPYTDHGHDGLFEKGKILNDQTLEVLCEMALSHAKAGAHFVAPSDMMDGRIGAIRASLDQSGFEDCAILAYTAKYASAFYGPFRDSLGAKVVGDKKTYQMDHRNRREAIRELELDLQEGADIVMVKPASHFLDIISDFRNVCNTPIAAYHVSGECALLELGAKNQLFDRNQAILEVTHSIFRAGADIVATYFALELAQLLRK